jgi:hypothetical protein
MSQTVKSVMVLAMVRAVQTADIKRVYGHQQ